VSATAAPAILAEGLGKCFRLYEPPGRRAAAWLSGGRLGRPRLLWALNNLSFAVAKGECLGIIGVNGAGKSTLLKLLSGVLEPSAGRIAVAGRLLALLELGTGFNPELSGRRNVMLSSELLGFPKGYAAARMAEIEAFADIGPFFDRPMRIYSSGMSTRLAFATFLYLDPDILVVDEALAVGDMFFQQKCLSAMAEMRRRGITVLLVSHDMAALGSLADRVMLLEGGGIAYLGEPEEAIARYFARGGAGRAGASADNDDAEALVRHSLLPAAADGAAAPLRILAADVRDGRGRRTLRARVGERIAIRLLIAAEAALARPEIELALYDRFNRLVSGLALGDLGAALPPLGAGERRIVSFRLEAALEPGEYTFALTAYERGDAASRAAWRTLARHAGLGPLSIAWERELLPFYGIASLDCRAALEATSAPD